MAEELAYYKSQYEALEAELQEFQASSKELEAELERDVEESEKRERKFQERAEKLGFEVEEWKVRTPCAPRLLRRNLATKAITHPMHRQSTSRARRRRTTRRTHCRRRSRPCAMPIAPYS